MKQIELHVHLPGESAPRLVAVNESDTVEDLIQRFAHDGHAELDLWVDGEEQPKHRHHKLHECGIGHHHHVHCRHRHEAGALVTVTINGKPHETHKGPNTVAHLRDIGKVPTDEVFSQLKEGQFVDLKDDATVIIHGCEVFASHIKSAGSS